MTVREFMLKKYPTNECMDCPIPKHHWETIQEYADKYHEAKVKNLSSNTVLAAVVSNMDIETAAVNAYKGKDLKEQRANIDKILAFENGAKWILSKLSNNLS